MTRIAAKSSYVGLAIVGLTLLGVGNRIPLTRSAAAIAARQDVVEPAPAGTTASKAIASDGPWAASQDFFAASSAAGTCSNRWCIPTHEKIGVLLAIAPDPSRTHMALAFDRTVEAIQLAAQSAGYVIDRYWLPWRSVNAPDAKGAGSLQAEKDKERGDLPGLLLFRWNGDSLAPAPRVLYVFLVADTSTAGVNGRQFLAALDYQREVCSSAACLDKDSTRIVGPTFSGSLNSLRRLTDQVGSPDKTDPTKLARRFVVYSGTVSSRCAIQNQRLLPPGDEPSPLCPAPSGTDLPASAVTFRSFVRDAESTVSLFVEYLKAEGDVKCDGHAEIAILSEAGTTYGAARLGSKGAAPEGQKGTAPGRESCTYSTFYYPREIASLRNAYTRLSKGATTSAQAGDPSRPYLPLTLTDEANGGDEPPDLALGQSPLSKEAVLMNWGAALRRGRYRYIGVTGSNVLDVLFVAAFVRSASPDARLFVIGSDLMFVRDLDNAPYIGTLALATYPLFGRNVDWTSQRPRQPFADQYEEGQFNATLTQIRELLSGIEGLSTADPYEDRAPFEATPSAGQPTSALPLWLTVIGTGGYWPVDLLSGASAKGPKELAAEDVGTAWRVLQLLLVTLSALHLLVLLTTSPIDRQLRDFALVNAAPLQRLFFCHLAGATLALGCGLTAAPVLVHGHAITPLTALAVIAMVLLLLVSVFLQASYWLHWGRERSQTDRTHQDGDTGAADGATPRALTLHTVGQTMLWAAAFGILYLWFGLFRVESGFYGFFFAYRAVNLATGVSPLAPFFPLLTAVYVWAVFEIWRLRFSDRMRPRLFPSHTSRHKPLATPPGRLAEVDVARAVERYRLDGIYVVLALAVFMIWFEFIDPSTPFHLFEHASFGYLYELLFSLVVFMMITAGFRLAQIWLALRRLLLELEDSRIRSAFGRLKGVTWNFWRQGGEQLEGIFNSRSMEAITQLLGHRQMGDADEDRLEQSDEDRIKALAAYAAKIKTHLDGREPLNSQLWMVSDLYQGLEGAIGRVQAAGSNLFLQAALADLRAVQTEFGRELQSEHASEIDAVTALRRQTAAVQAALESALGVLQLLSSADVANQDIRACHELPEKLHERRFRFFAVRSTLEQLRPMAQGDDAGTERASLTALIHSVDNIHSSFQNSLAEVFQQAWGVLQVYWNKLDAQLLAKPLEAPTAEGKAVLPATAGSYDCRSPETRQREWLEEFIALRFVAFVRGVLAHVRHLMMFLALSFSLVMLSLNVYSFEPHQSLIWSFTIVFGVIGFMVVGVLMQLHRNEVLNRATGGNANELGLDFYIRIAAFGIGPVATLLATHFPAISHYFLSFLQPSLQTLK